MRILKALIALYEVLLGISSVAASFCMIGVMAGQCPVDWALVCIGGVAMFAALLLIFMVIQLHHENE